MAADWFALVGGREVGPLTDAQLKQLANDGELQPFGSVRRGEKSEWILAKNVRGLFDKPRSEDASEGLGASTHRNQSPNVREIASQQQGFQESVRILSQCPDCQSPISAAARKCPKCGRPFFRPSRYVAIALALFLGGLGAHKFYLRQTNQAVLYLLFFWTFIPALIGFIEGLQYLSTNDNDFAIEYGNIPQTTSQQVADSATVQQPPKRIHGPSLPDDELTIHRNLRMFVGAVLILGAIVFILAFKSLLAAIVFAILGIATLPATSSWINSLEFVRQSGLTIEGVVQWLVGILALVAATSALVQAQWLATVLLMTVALCAIPLIWERYTQRVDFIRSYGTFTRWVVALIALFLLPTHIGQPGPPAERQSQSVGQDLDDISQNLRPHFREDVAQKLAVSGDASLRDDIGHWLDQNPLAPHILSLYRRNGQIYLERLFSDGKSITVEMRQRSVPSGADFEYVPANGDYFRIGNSGELEWWDEDGHFLTSPRAN